MILYKHKNNRESAIQIIKQEGRKAEVRYWVKCENGWCLVSLQTSKINLRPPLEYTKIIIHEDE